MSNLSFEFDINLQKAPYPSVIRRKKEALPKIPSLRKYLLLAYQIKQLIEDSSDITFKKIANWVGVTEPRIKQIALLLSLCPKIQEDILLMDDEKLRHIREYQLRMIRLEIDWKKQIILWKNLSK
jgi:hypothetical protein